MFSFKNFLVVPVLARCFLVYSNLLLSVRLQFAFLARCPTVGIDTLIKMGWFVRLCWLWRWVLIHGALLCCRDPSWIPFPPPFRRPLTRHLSKRPGLSWLLPRTVGHWSSLRSRVSCRRKCLDQPVYCAVLKLYSNLILSLCECDTATRSYVEWSCPCCWWKYFDILVSDRWIK